MQRRKKQKFVSFACPQVVEEQLETLVKKTGESKGALIKRLISEAFSRLKKS